MQKYTLTLFVILFALFPLHSDAQRSDVQQRSWSERVGLLIDGGAEYSGRISFYDQFQADSLSAENRKTLEPVERFPEAFQTAGGRFRFGLLNRPILDFSFDRPVGGSVEQDKVFAFREHKVENLSNYALGVDIAPLWYVLIPDSPWLIRTLLSVRLRTHREMAHTFFRPEDTIHALGTSNDFSDARVNDQTGLLEYTPNQEYVYEAFYRYQSIDIPLLYGVQQMEDTETGEKTDTDLLLSLRIGLSRWNIDRPYFTRFPQWDNAVYTYLVNEETIALFGELDMQVDRGRDRFMPSFGMRISGDWGIASSLTNNRFDLHDLYYPDSDEDLDPETYKVETDLYFTFNLISSRRVRVSLRHKLSMHVYLSQVNNFAKNFDRYYQRDILLFGSAALAFSF